MDKRICQYLWRGLTIDENGRKINDIRHKTRCISKMTEPSIWNYDGSSTLQAPTENSAVHIIPVKTYKHPDKTLRDKEAILVLCKTSLPNDTIAMTMENLKNNNDNLMIGFELECFMIDKLTNLPLGIKEIQSSDHYCGTSNIIDTRIQSYLNEVCMNGLEMGLNITGHNIEVAYGQIEFQICDFALDACHDLEVLKYLMSYIGNKPEYNVYINYNCKPLGANHNGSGMHTNFSTKEMRNLNDMNLTKSLVEKLGEHHEEAMKIYGFDNELRLTGKHETSSFYKFTYAVGSRSSSVRLQTKYDKNTNEIIEDATYAEDRRPNPTADQYLIVDHIYRYIC